MAELNMLLSELEQFRDHLIQQKKDRMVEMRTYQSRLRAELKALEKVDNFSFISLLELYPVT